MTWRTLLPFLPLLAGCSGSDAVNGYEPTAIYPPRNDLLVVNLTQVAPPTNAVASARGKLDDSIADLGSRGGEVITPARLTSAQRTAINDSLLLLFGTPAEPRVEHPDAARYGLTPEKLAAGSRVYKAHCVHCHGMTGDGRGPTSLWVYPHARDFRQGQFKFVSTTSGQGWPTRSDLHRAVRRGVSGNSMPPFALLSDEAIDDVTSYTLHLMLRGVMEYDLIRAAEDLETVTNIKAEAHKKWILRFASWSAAQATELDVSRVPKLEPQHADGDPAYAERVRHGHDLFRGEVTGCIKCHADYGRNSLYRYDVWGVAVKPAALTEGRPRGGGDAADYVRRITCGIPGSGMPAATLSEADLHDLVLFLRALPDPQHLPADVRSAVYPEVK